jgi:hypothetical protein
MRYEYQTRGGVMRPLKAGRRCAIEFNGRRRAQWTSPDDAMVAVVYHRAGLAGWDRTRLVVSDEQLCWRQLGENL